MHNYLDSLCNLLDDLADPKSISCSIDCCARAALEDLCKTILELRSNSFARVMGTKVY